MYFMDQSSPHTQPCMIHKVFWDHGLDRFSQLFHLNAFILHMFAYGWILWYWFFVFICVCSPISLGFLDYHSIHHIKVTICSSFNKPSCLLWYPWCLVAITTWGLILSLLSFRTLKKINALVPLVFHQCFVWFETCGKPFSSFSNSQFLSS